MWTIDHDMLVERTKIYWNKTNKQKTKNTDTIDSELEFNLHL